MRECIRSIMWVILTIVTVYLLAGPVWDIICFVLDGIFDFIIMCLSFIVMFKVIKYIILYHMFNLFK